MRNFNSELERNVAIRLEIEAATRRADQFDREHILERAKLERDIQEQLLISRDFEKATSDERLAAVRKAIELRTAQIKIDKNAAANRASIAIAEHARLDKDDEREEEAFKKREEARRRLYR